MAGGVLSSLRLLGGSSTKRRVGLPRLSLSSLGMETVAAPGDSHGPQEGSYSPQESLELALLDWVAEIHRQASEPGG